MSTIQTTELTEFVDRLRTMHRDLDKASFVQAVKEITDVPLRKPAWAEDVEVESDWPWINVIYSADLINVDELGAYLKQTIGIAIDDDPRLKKAAGDLDVERVYVDIFNRLGSVSATLSSHEMSVLGQSLLTIAASVAADEVSA